MPLTIRYGLPLLAVVLIGFWAWDELVPPSAHLRVIDGAGEPAAVSVPVELFAYDSSPSAPSPMPSLGTFELDDSGVLSVSRDVIGDAALARLDVPDHGIAYGYLEPGQRTELRLGALLAVEGVVKNHEDAPLAGARVQAFGGGSRGVLLAETETGADGKFRFDRLSDSLPGATFRVRADGYGITDTIWTVGDPPVTVALEPTEPARGRLVAPPDAGGDEPDLGGLEVRLHHVPGLTSCTGPDGTFTIPHAPPPPARVSVLVPDLPAGWTYRRTAVQAGQSTDVEIMRSRKIRGRVVNGHDGSGIAGATVQHDHGPLAVEATRTDGEGRFELDRVPLGTVDVFAFLIVDRSALPADARQGRGRGRKVMIDGFDTVVVRSDVAPDELVITLW